MTEHKTVEKQSAGLYDPYDFLGQGVKSNKNFTQKQHQQNNKSFKIKNDDSL